LKWYLVEFQRANNLTLFGPGDAFRLQKDEGLFDDITENEYKVKIRVRIKWPTCHNDWMLLC
jgi:hypothetical protein